MPHAITVTPILDESCICSVRMENGDIISLSSNQLQATSIPEYLKAGIEYHQMRVEGDNCIIILTAEQGQWGYTVVWDYTKNKLVHLSNTPFAGHATILDNRLVIVYLVQYWGHPADLWYSVSPLELVDSNYEPDTFPLDISLDGSTKDPASFFAAVEVFQKDRKAFIRYREQEVYIDKLPDDEIVSVE